jgi:hypothetical protein
MDDPRTALEFLKELADLGFGNSDFRLLHHAGQAASISEHTTYCEKMAKRGGRFQRGKNNECVNRRLLWVLEQFVSARASSPGSRDFSSLAEEAYRTIR